LSKIFKKVKELLDSEEIFALATVIKVKGSTPRSVGSKMLITINGKTYGSIGGGRIESLVVRAALETLHDGRSKIVRHIL
jgi:xanthine dehydrogenase accessory factor